MFKIGLVKSAFLNEAETRAKLADFIEQTPTFSMGPECAKFEEDFAAKQGRKFAVFVNSGSSANLILIQALLNLGRLEKGDKVGISAITWSTNVMPLIKLGLMPVAIDCELDTLNVSPRTLKEHIHDIKALFLTNALGLADDIEEITRICAAHNVLLLEDNCEALGSKVGEKLLGNFGLASTFSFFLGHHLSTLEGGMVATDDEELRDMLIIVRAHGWARHLSPDKKAELRAKHGIEPFYELYTFYDLGYNVRPTEINGFLGNLQLEYWNEIVQKRHANFLRLFKMIGNNPELLPLRVDHMSVISNFGVPVMAKDKKTYSKYRTKFQEAGVEIRPIIAGDITQQPFYKKYVAGNQSAPNAAMINDNAFYFGNNAELTEEEVALLAKLLEA